MCACTSILVKIHEVFNLCSDGTRSLKVLQNATVKRGQEKYNSVSKGFKTFKDKLCKCLMRKDNKALWKSECLGSHVSMMVLC